MVERWSKEKAWKWWNEHDWLVGCNYVPSKTPVLSIWKDDNREEILPSVRHELELMKSIGYNTVRMSISGGFNTWYYDKEQFLNTMDFVLSLLDEYGITMMPVLFGDCLPFGRPEVVKVWKPVPGHGHYDVGYHGGHAHSAHIVPPKDAIGWTLWDEEEYRPALEEFVREVITRFAKDERVIIWDLWNEPGNSKRHGKSIPILKKLFEIARSCDPIQPLTSGCWSYPKGYGVVEGVDLEPIQKLATDLSDIVSFHDYESFDIIQNIVSQLEKDQGRPMANTEWLHRILNNNIEDQIPFYHDKKIASYNWGLVAGYSQHYLPWEWLKASRPELDYSKWQHDLFRQDGVTPYDEKEIEIIKKYTGAK